MNNNEYDKIMSQIVGFKEFKQELRNQIEVAERSKAPIILLDEFEREERNN